MGKRTAPPSRENIALQYAVALKLATWMAFGLDTERTVFYRQSDVPECTELAWWEDPSSCSATFRDHF